MASKNINSNVRISKNNSSKGRTNKANAAPAETTNATNDETVVAHTGAGTVVPKKPRKERAKGLQTSKDVQVKLMFDGLEAVQDAYTHGHVTRGTIVRAVKELEAQNRGGALVEALREWAGEFISKNATGARGRAAMVPGDLRMLTAQQVKDTGVFLRLPLSALSGAKKGDLLAVSANSDGTILTVKLQSA